jgi:pimeloyl-ACP methyl ester carboxylesterase
LKRGWIKFYKITAIVLGVLLVLYLGISWYGSRTAMEIPRLPVVYNPAELGVPYEDVAFKSRGDNITLNGWFIPGENKDVIVFVNGGFQNRIDDNSDTGGIARALAEKGHNVLLWDMRGRGESEGQGRTLSNIDEDVGGAVDYLESRGFGAGDICLLGFSTGAASACIYASGNSLGAIILVGCFIDCPTMLTRQAKALGLPIFVAYFFLPGGKFFTHWLYDFTMINPIDVVPDVDCPILFVHEENDAFINSEETQRLCRASPNPASEIWEVPGAEHSQAFKTHPVEFINKINEFIGRTIGLTAD